MTCINFPEVPGFAVQTDYLFHGFQLRLLPLLLAICRWFGQNEHAGLDLELMGVPESLLLVRQSVVDMFRHHILNTNETSVSFVGIVYQALTKI
jgi:hypothetical protein